MPAHRCVTFAPRPSPPVTQIGRMEMGVQLIHSEKNILNYDNDLGLVTITKMIRRKNTFLSTNLYTFISYLE